MPNTDRESRGPMSPAPALPWSPRVLIVEDEPAYRELMEGALELLGIPCQHAWNAEEALRILETETFDLVTCDIHMPGMGGLKLYEALLEQGNSVTGRFVFVSGALQVSGVLEKIRAWGRRLLEKPFELAQLVALGNDLVARRESRGAAVTL